MKIRLTKPVYIVAACAALASVPAVTQAVEQSAMDTCIQTFVSEQLPAGRKIEVVTREVRPLQWGSARSSRIDVSAKGKRSGKEIASATCVVDRHGGLVAMYVQGERIRLAQSDAALTPGG